MNGNHIRHRYKHDGFICAISERKKLSEGLGTCMSTSPPLHGLFDLAVAQLRGSGSDGASIWWSWKSPWPLMCTSLSTRRGRPRTYPDTQRVPRPLGPPPDPSLWPLGVNLTHWARRWERLERKPSFLCFWLPRCLRRRVASWSESSGKRRTSGKRTSAIFERALRASTLFFTGRSDTPRHTSATQDKNAKQRISIPKHLSLQNVVQRREASCRQAYTHRGWGGPEQKGRRDSSLHNRPNLQRCPAQTGGCLQSLPYPVRSACQLIKTSHKKTTS